MLERRPGSTSRFKDHDLNKDFNYDLNNDLSMMWAINKCKCYILIYMFMQKYTYICWIHTDAMN